MIGDKLSGVMGDTLIVAVQGLGQGIPNLYYGWGTARELGSLPVLAAAGGGGLVSGRQGLMYAAGLNLPPSSS